jgi:hypothetical protein
MSFKKILVGFSMVLFSFQLAPVQQVGAFLYNSQLTEEIPHSQEDSGMKFQDDLLKQLISPLWDEGECEQGPGSFQKGKAVDFCIKTRSSDDIQTPPPNLIA